MVGQVFPSPVWDSNKTLVDVYHRDVHHINWLYSMGSFCGTALLLQVLILWSSHHQPNPFHEAPGILKDVSIFFDVGLGSKFLLAIFSGHKIQHVVFFLQKESPFPAPVS